jgi:membrane-bound lytic murein transglycosylase A
MPLSAASKKIVATALAVFMALALIIAVGCGPKPRPRVTARDALQRVPEQEWPVLYDDMDAASLYEACQQSLAYLKRVPQDRKFYFGDYAVSAAQMAEGITRLQDVLVRYPDAAARTEALKKEFVLFASVGRDGQGGVLFTGYYEPMLQGRRKPVDAFQYPLYALPDDLVWIDLRHFGDDLPKKKLVGQVRDHRVKPFPDREAIDYKQAIKDSARVLAYVNDPVDAFFLHIQGSGQVEFPDGDRLRLGYAATNGHPYRSIGKLLLKEDLMEPDGMSMQAIKRFLAENPKHLRRVLSHNPSYVFFRPLDAVGGPLGCYEVPLTAGRSIATDRRIFPGLAMCFIQGQTPVPDGGTAPFMRLVLNQDTGGAIRGPGRLDLFYGTGALAGELAGRMKYEGRLFFLAPRLP